MQKYNIGITNLRLAMLDELIKAKTPLCFDDFKTQANKTTFYRNMELFEKCELVVKIDLDGKGYYQLNRGSKALFVCDLCHNTKDIKMPEIDATHVNSVLVKGICKDCEEHK